MSALSISNVFLSSVIPASARLAFIDDAKASILSMPSVMPKSMCGDWHRHGKGQLIYPRKGRCRIYTHDRVWVGSPRKAIWIPAGVEHTLQAIDQLNVHNIYIDTLAIDGLSKVSHLVIVTALLDELLEFSNNLPVHASHYKCTYWHALNLIVDLIRLSTDVITPTLPLSGDRRLRTIMEALINDPGNDQSLEQWACIACSSSRTIARLFVSETGMTFRQWRQHLRVVEAISHLDDGCSISQTAYDLGYTSQSSFTAMFRRITGCSPTEFLQSN
ncbi:helix-turn-helix domain-containing protein [Zymobacter palmae]|uniref:helix-turn-helix domain-containing protein n=1 Tax=Zymobacter palmae TaxID=33074 RepID=UPI0009FD909A|nr:helix-turn-helix transcriptional regulator [Zymobacter palmae]